jgi:hypothetical protein
MTFQIRTTDWIWCFYKVSILKICIESIPTNIVDHIRLTPELIPIGLYVIHRIHFQEKVSNILEFVSKVQGDIQTLILSGSDERSQSKPERGARAAGPLGICVGGPSDELLSERTRCPVQ